MKRQIHVLKSEHQWPRQGASTRYNTESTAISVPTFSCHHNGPGLSIASSMIYDFNTGQA